VVTARELAYGTYGAWRLALFDRHGLSYFDNTIEAFWRSFQAAVIAAPGYALFVALQLASYELSSGPVRIFLVEAIAYVIRWVAFPLVVWYVAQFLSRSDRYYRYMAAYNWAQLLVVALFLVITAVAKEGLFPSPVGEALSVLAMVASLAYQWFITRAGLDIKGGAAAAIVMLDLIISLILNSVTLRLL
jgi:hypothetical protein